jgi:VanZ family protein
MLPCLWTLQIFYFSSLPRGSYPKVDDQHLDTSYLQYVYHFGQYFCLALLLYRAKLHSALPAKTAEHIRQMPKRTLVIIAVVALVDELIQIPVPTRTFTLRDVMADVAGGGFALLLMQLGKRSKDAQRREAAG